MRGYVFDGRVLKCDVHPCHASLYSCRRTFLPLRRQKVTADAIMNTTSSTTNKPKATQPTAPGGGGGSSAVPLPQRWIDAAKRSDRAEMEYVLAQSEAQLVPP